jgi:hypothetical protein
VYGAAKSKKTFAITMAIAAAVGGKFGPFEGHLPPDKSKVILFDTEQDVYRATRTARRIMRMVGAPPDTFHKNFDAYYFPGDEPEKIMAAISKVLAVTPNVGMVIIDGLVDLSFDINDPKEAPVVIKTVQRWAVEYNIHIIGVLHQNKGNENMRGHIGTWALNKAESVAHVRRDANNKDVSSVSPSETRDKAFEPFAFIIKETGLPEIISGWVPTNDDKGNKKQSKPRPSNLDPHTNYNILVWLHEHTEGKETTYSKMCDLIKLAVADKTGHQIGDGIVREYLTHYQDVDRVIIKQGTSGTQKAHYTIELPPPPSERGVSKATAKSNQVEMGISGVNMHDQEPF